MKQIRSSLKKFQKKINLENGRFPGDLFNFRRFSNSETPLWSNKKKRILVIGSGIGGMASASLFAHIGHEVTVLEMNNDLIGGHARWLTIGGIKFSMGPQYVWEFGDGETGDNFLKFINIKNTNPFELMATDGFERIFIGYKNSKINSYYINFKVPLGLDNFKNHMITLFPEERDRIDLLFSDMIGVYNAFKKFFKNHRGSEGRILLAAKFFLIGDPPLALKIKLGQTLFMSLSEWFDLYGISSFVRRIIYGHGGIFAESESEMSALAFIIGTGNYHRGARFPLNGFHHFFNSMVSAIIKNKGTVETGKKVISLSVENNRVTKAECEDGSEYTCDYIFSDISPRLTYKLLGRDNCKFYYTPSYSIPAICIGIERGIDLLSELKGRNFWWQDGNEVEYCSNDVTLPPRMLYIGSPTANGNSGLENYEKDALVVYCPGNYLQEKEIYKRGDAAVQAFKEKLISQVVSILDQNVFPGLKSKMLFAEVISSIDVERETGSEMGNAYGRRLNVNEILKGSIEEDNCPENLFNVSAAKNMPGIAGGIYTATKLFEELTGIMVK